jgi:hypothetical protein
MRGPWIGCAPTTPPLRRVSEDGFQLDDRAGEPDPIESDEPLRQALRQVARVRQESIAALVASHLT